MSEKEKTSDAVRITRIVSPTVLIIALALIFKPEIGKVLSGGCFELKIAQVGLGLSDKSLCTQEEFEKAKNDLVEAVGKQAQEVAAVSFDKYETRIADFERKNSELVQNVRKFQDEITVANKKQAEYKAFVDATVQRARTREALTVANQLSNKFTAIYGEEMQLIQMEPVQVVDPEVVAEQNAAIRQDYIKTSRSNVTRVQENVTIERRK